MSSKSLSAVGSASWDRNDIFLSSSVVVDQDTVPASLAAAVEKDDSTLSYAYGLLAASYIPETDLSLFFEQIEDIVAQADETPTTLYVS